LNNSILKLFDLKNQNIIITGSAGRLGSQFATTLSENGANVILVDINEKKNLILEKKLKKKYNTKAKSYIVDITQPTEITKFKKEFFKKFNDVYGLINNAHVNFPPKTVNFDLENYPIESWQKYVEIHLTATFLMCREFGTIMAKKQNGTIVNISSIYGLVGPDQRIYGTSKLNTPPSYSAVKAGVVNLTRYFASYWAGKNIRVNTLTPGGIKDSTYQSQQFIKNYSSKTMLNRMAKNNDFNGAILFLMSNASSYMTGANLIVDGGWTAW
jgi:NAD(P)-dependent dehydrogenase (short-subunit alcohol dehydrogenase family)